MEDVIVDDLLSGIIQGRFDAEDLLPSESDLSRRYCVPRMVVRRAFSQLEERGLVRSQRGKGRFLSSPKKHMVLTLRGGVSFSEKIRNSGSDLVTHVHTARRASWNPDIWHRLGLDSAKDRVFELSLLRVIDKDPAALHISFLPELLFPDIQAKCNTVLSLYDFFIEKGYEGLHSRHATLDVTLPTLEEQQALAVPALVPLMLAEYETHSDSCILSVNKSIYRGDIFSYKLD